MVCLANLQGTRMLSWGWSRALLLAVVFGGRPESMSAARGAKRSSLARRRRDLRSLGRARSTAGEAHAPTSPRWRHRHHNRSLFSRDQSWRLGLRGGTAPRPHGPTKPPRHFYGNRKIFKFQPDAMAATLTPFAPARRALSNRTRRHFLVSFTLCPPVSLP